MIAALSFQDVIDAVPDPAAIVDREAVVVAVNRAWIARTRRHHSGDVSPGIGERYLTACSLADGALPPRTDDVADGLMAVLSGTTGHAEIDYELVRMGAAGIECREPFRCSITPIGSSAQNPFDGATDTPVGVSPHHALVVHRPFGPDAFAQLSTIDLLTKVPNRTMFMAHLDHALGSLVAGDDQYVGLLACDLDGFKAINRSFGHAVGDEVLVAVATRLQRSLRPLDIVARTGSDEFLVLLREVPSVEEANAVADRIVRSIDAPFALGSHRIGLSVSVGVVTSADPDADRELLVSAAETALAQAKIAGRNCAASFRGVLSTPSIPSNIRLDVVDALDDGRIHVRYQPILDTSYLDRRVVSFEGLLRWDHPEHGILQAGAFLDILKTQGLMATVAQLVLSRATHEAAAWPDTPGAPAPTLSLNLSPEQFSHPRLVQWVVDALESSGLPPQRLELEITESSALAATPGVRETAIDLQSIGVGLAIDDFGTGYSSFDRLRYFPHSTLKLDRSLVSGADHDPFLRRVVPTIAQMCADLDIRCIAEGVETSDEAAMLLQAGIPLQQGFLHGQAISAAEVACSLSDASSSARSEQSQPLKRLA